MSDSMSAYYDDLVDYQRLCTLLDETYSEKNLYERLDKLKRDPRIEFANYQYQLKGK